MQREKKKTEDAGPVASQVTDQEVVILCPMREIQGREMVHVPWSRSDIYQFTDEFPRLRESPREWYQRVDRIVRLSPVLWVNLNAFFDIVVPRDLWTDCMVAIGWSTEEQERDSKTSKLFPIVMEKYNMVIAFLKRKVAPDEIDWVKINGTRQEPKEAPVFCSAS